MGAGLGAGATVLGSWLTVRHHAAQAREQAAQQQIADLHRRKEAAYSNAIRSLLRARNRRSALSAGGGSYIAKEDVGTFFDDLVEAQYWLSVLTTVCGAKQRLAIERASASLNSTVEQIVQSPPQELSMQEPRRKRGDLSAIYDQVLAAARDELGPQSASAAVVSPPPSAGDG
jgi:hypothetical protein